MDLFSLVAKLTLDAKDYEKALKDAERKGQKVKVDATGKISLKDDFSAALDSASRKAQNTDLKAQGEITAEDKYTKALGTASEAMQGFDETAQGEVEAEDKTEEGLGQAAEAIDGFDEDGEGTITAEDDTAEGIGYAQTAIEDFDADGEGSITASDDTAQGIGDAETSLSQFDAEGEGSITAADETSQGIGDARTAIEDFDAEGEGSISVDDEYSTDLSTADSDITGFDAEGKGVLDLDKEAFDKGLSDAESDAEKFPDKLSSALEKAKTALTASGIVAAIKKVSAAIAGMVRDSAAYADRVDKESDALHISTRAYQELDHALSQSGASIDTVKKGFQNLYELWSNGEPSEEAKTLLGILGDIQQQTGIDLSVSNFSSVEDQFVAMLKALADMGDTAERASILEKIFGERKGADLNSLLKDGAAGIDTLIKEAHELGLIMSDEDITNGVQYGDAVANMDAAVNALKNNISSGLFPLLTQAAQMITGIISFFTGEDTSAAGMFNSIDESMTKAFADAGKDEAVTLSLIKALKDMSEETGKCKGNLEQWQKTADALIKLCPELASQINTVTGEINEESGSLEENAKQWYANMRAKILADALKSKQEVVAGKLSETIEAQLNVEVAKGEAEYAYKTFAEGFAEQYKKYNPNAKEGDWLSYLGFSSMAEFNSANYDRMFAAREMMFQTTGQYVGDVGLLNKITALEQAAQALKKAEQEYLKALKLYEDSAAAGQKLADRWKEAAETKGEEATEGVKEGAEEGAEAVDGLADAIDGLEDKEVTVTVNVEGDGADAFIEAFKEDFNTLFGGGKKDGSFAKGEWSVPFDGYIAELHRGERILTASQARHEDNSNGSAEIVDAIRALRTDMTNLQLVVGQKTFGRTVVQYGGKRLNGYLGSAEDKVAAGYGWG